MKRILTVQDISCLGKCSITLALPILSAMGLETAVLPTAILSTHTAFASPVIRDLTPQLLPTLDHWEAIGAEFDAIYVGYLGKPELVEQVAELVKRFSPKLLLVDPVMGDHGKLYAGFHMSYVEKLRSLCAQAQVILPNLTEACLLADVPYVEAPDEAFVKKLLKKLEALGCPCVILTGMGKTPEQTGAVGLWQGEFLECSRPRLPYSYHGTGDIFASVCAGGLTLGAPFPRVLDLAADYTARCMEDTFALERDSRFGVCFEKALPMLWQATRNL